MDLVVNLLTFVAALVTVVTVHEAGHYVAGLLIGIPAREMKIVLFPRNVEKSGLPVAGYLVEISRRLGVVFVMGVVLFGVTILVLV